MPGHWLLAPYNLGMKLGRILTHTGRLWWKHWIAILVLNILWFLLQIPIITGPPATSTFYAIGRRLIDDEVWDYQDLWQIFRSSFLQGWIWALPNLIVFVVISVNLMAYQNSGISWIALRIFWSLLLVGWLTMNLFYWPFWFLSTEPTWRQTLSNCWKLLLMHPFRAVGLVFLIVVLLAIGSLLVVPLPFGLVGLFIFATTLFVDQAVAQNSNNPAVNRTK